jgi:hypothetical protein
MPQPQRQPAARASSSAVEELVNALRHDAPADHIKDVLAVVDVVERRLAAS